VSELSTFASSLVGGGVFQKESQEMLTLSWLKVWKKSKKREWGKKEKEKI